MSSDHLMDSLRMVLVSWRDSRGLTLCFWIKSWLPVTRTVRAIGLINQPCATMTKCAPLPSPQDPVLLSVAWPCRQMPADPW